MSKWESGRGYPSIDSLKEISRFFSVTIDELITPDEIVTAAEDDKKALMDKYSSLASGMLDILLALLLFVPVFGNGSDAPSAVSLIALTGVSPWVRIVLRGRCLEPRQARLEQDNAGSGDGAVGRLRCGFHSDEAAIRRHHILCPASDQDGPSPWPRRQCMMCVPA